MIQKVGDRMKAQEVMERMQRGGSDIVFQYDGLESGVAFDTKDGCYELTAWNGAWNRTYDSFEEAFTDTAIFREGLMKLIDDGRVEVCFE